MTVKVGSTDALDWAADAMLAIATEDDGVKASAVMAGYFALAIEAGRKAGKASAEFKVNGIAPVSPIASEFVGLGFDKVEQLVFAIAPDNAVEIYVDGVTAIRIGEARNVAVVDAGAANVLRGYPSYPSKPGRPALPLNVVASMRDRAFFDATTGHRMDKAFHERWRGHMEDFPSLPPYGYCPACGAPGKTRERRPNGLDTCENGHTYPSASATLTGKPATGVGI
jgi:hypothetical protein